MEWCGPSWLRPVFSRPSPLIRGAAGGEVRLRHGRHFARTEARPPSSGANGAFTLVELLVVVAVVAILAAFLLPTLSRAKAGAQRAACLSNFRQLQLGWHLYADANNGVLAVNWDGNEAGQTVDVPSWVAGCVGFFSQLYPPHPHDATNTQYLVPGLWGSIGSYVGSARVYRCPADRSQVQIGGRQYDRVRSVSMNYRVGPEVQNVAYDIFDPFRVYRRYTDFDAPGPARTFVFIDEHESTIDGPAFNPPWICDGGMFHWHLALPASRHNGTSATISFADGHVELHRWIDPRTRIAIVKPDPVQGLWGYEPEDPVSPTNPDAQWLFERSTAAKPSVTSLEQP